MHVPAENLIGEENQGWTYAKFLLGHERYEHRRRRRLEARLERLREIAAAEMRPTAAGR